MQTETRQGSPLESLKITPFTLTGAGLARWRLPVRLLLVCLLLVGLWNWVGQEPQRQWQPGAPIHVVAGGRHYRVSPDEMSALQAYSATYFQERAEEGQARLQGSTGAHLEQLFARVEGQLPGFLDWYYSLPGEYSRIGMGLASLLGWHEGDYVRDRAARMLFHETNWQGSLMRLETGARAQLAQYDAITRESWLAGIMERLEPHQVPAPLPSANSAESSDRARLSIDALEQQLADVSLLSLDERLAISTGGAVAGVALWRGAARAATTRGGVRPQPGGPVGGWPGPEVPPPGVVLPVPRVVLWPWGVPWWRAQWPG